MRLATAVALFSLIAGVERIRAQEDGSTNEIVRAAVHSIASQHMERGRSVILRVPADDAALAAAMSKTNTGLPAAPSDSVFLCSRGRCQIVGGKVAIAAEQPVIEGIKAKIRIWIATDAPEDLTGLAREVWSVTLARRGATWVVESKELFLQT